MNDSDAKLVGEMVHELFSQTTKGQIAFVMDLVRKHNRLRAMAVIRAHRLTHEELNFPQLSQALQTDFDKYDESRQARSKERIVDAVRYLARTKWGIQAYETMTDENVILTHYLDCWDHVQKNSPGEAGLRYVRCAIYDTVREAFLEMGKDWNEAKGLAESVVNLRDGERLNQPTVLAGAQ